MSQIATADHRLTPSNSFAIGHPPRITRGSQPDVEVPTPAVPANHMPPSAVCRTRRSNRSRQPRVPTTIALHHTHSPLTGRREPTGDCLGRSRSKARHSKSPITANRQLCAAHHPRCGVATGKRNPQSQFAIRHPSVANAGHHAQSATAIRTRRLSSAVFGSQSAIRRSAPAARYWSVLNHLPPMTLGRLRFAIRSLPSVLGLSLDLARPSPSVVRPPSLIIHRSSLTVSRPPFVVRRSSFVVRPSSFVVRRSSFVDN